MLEFEHAVRTVQTTRGSVPDDVKLKFYGLYKRATVGHAPPADYAFWDLVGRSKHDAWKAVSSMTEDDAKREYVRLFNEVRAAQR